MSALRILAVPAAALVILAGTAATAAEAQSRVVSFADLDLSQASHARTLERRIRSAAINVCGGAMPRDLAARAAAQKCVAAAVSHALPKAETAIASARTNREAAENPSTASGRS